MRTLQRAFWSGTLANGPMTLVLLLGANVTRRMRALPPARLTAEVARPLEEVLPSSRRQDLTMIGHFFYSTFVAGAYSSAMSWLKPKSLKGELVSGTLFGFGVWALSYPGWIEGLGLRARASKLSRTENMWMIAAHLVWGASLGFFEGELRRLGKSSLDALHS